MVIFRMLNTEIKDRQGFMEGRIAELESKPANAQVIDPALLDADGACRLWRDH